MVTVLDSTHPVARKEHQCQLCLRTIEPGERYNRQSNLSVEVGFYVYKACAHCAAFVKALDAEDVDWYEPEFGYTRDDLDYVDTLPTVYLARLRAQFRREWRSRDGALYSVPEIAEQAGGDRG